jgi:hypothetical protein
MNVTADMQQRNASHVRIVQSTESALNGVWCFVARGSLSIARCAFDAVEVKSAT